MKNYEIRKLLNKAESTNDNELIYLTNKLISERNYLIEIAYKDSLTGLNNRRVLNNIENCSAIVICDIDDYKQVNDLYGHKEGDSIIQVVSDIIKNNIGENDCACRYGGDEILIIFKTGSEDYVCNKIESIRQMIETNIRLSYKHNTTVSFGIAINKGNDLNELIEQADEALYESKGRGKNQVTVYSSKSKKLNYR